jgi:hypothetical protein
LRRRNNRCFSLVGCDFRQRREIARLKREAKAAATGEPGTTPDMNELFEYWQLLLVSRFFWAGLGCCSRRYAAGGS